MIASAPKAPPALVSAKHLCNQLNCSIRTIWRLRDSGEMPRPVQLGSMIRWKADEINAWISQGCPPTSKG